MIVGAGHSGLAAPSAHTRTRSAGVSDRVGFHVHDVAEASLDERYDVIMVFEVLHELSKPVSVLRACRRRLAPDGALIVGDERVADAFPAPGDAVERFMCVASVLHCLPAAEAEPPSAGTGTVMRADTVRRYGAQAASRASRSCPSSTTSSGSTAWCRK